MSYSVKTIQWFNDDKNVGSLDTKRKNVGTGLVGAPSCGDVMKLQIEVDEKNDIILDAKFKTFGCGAAVSASAYATEQIKGKSIDDAMKIKNSDILRELSLPPVKVHCSILAESAIKAAIEDYRTKKTK